jgi:hypothetical protein
MKNVSARQYFEEGSGIVTLCGSNGFFPECMEANRALTLQNWVVLMCGIWAKSYHKDSEPLDRDYSLIKKLHFYKILESDAIVVVSDKSLYYGESTTEEIAFAKHRNIPVFYFDGEIFSGWELVDKIPDRYADTSLIDSFRANLAG